MPFACSFFIGLLWLAWSRFGGIGLFALSPLAFALGTTLLQALFDAGQGCQVASLGCAGDSALAAGASVSAPMFSAAGSTFSAAFSAAALPADFAGQAALALRGFCWAGLPTAQAFFRCWCIGANLPH